MQTPVVTISFEATPAQAAAALASTLSDHVDEIARARAEWLLATALPVFAFLREKDVKVFSAMDFKEFIRLENLISLTEDDVAVPDELIAELQDYLEALPGYTKTLGLKQGQTPRNSHSEVSVLVRRIFRAADYRIS